MIRLTLAIDAMGGDFGPCVTVPAALQILSSYSSLELLLVGDPDKIKPFLAKADSPDIIGRLQIIAAGSVIASDVKPSQAIRQRDDSSMHIALSLVREGKARACISAGNTGALMVLARRLLKSLEGIERPALMSILPHKNQGKTVLLDLGANIQADSKMLTQFALMGAVMAEEVLAIHAPRVSLLNVGQEGNKGPESVRDAAEKLSVLPGIRFTGYIEGNDLLTGKTDVIVCDGFAGNVMLKTMEGVIRVLPSLLDSQGGRVRKRWLKFFESRVIKYLKKRFGHLNPDHYNGACLIGLREIVIKSHGAANVQAFATAIEQALKAVEREVPEKIATRLKQY